MDQPIARCRHRDFFHHLMADHDDHCCVGCSLRITCDKGDGSWEVADMGAYPAGDPEPLPEAEQRRALTRLDAVMRGKRGWRARLCRSQPWELGHQRASPRLHPTSHPTSTPRRARKW